MGMSRVLYGVVALPFLTGVALAKPMPLDQEQMEDTTRIEQVTAPRGCLLASCTLNFAELFTLGGLPSSSQNNTKENLGAVINSLENIQLKNIQFPINSLPVFLPILGPPVFTPTNPLPQPIIPMPIPGVRLPAPLP
jgi:hypothetical protein